MGDYLGKVIKVELLNKFYYKGRVISDDDNFLKIIDLNNREVLINKKSIATLEVYNG